jgi:hypothetical protein
VRRLTLLAGAAVAQLSIAGRLGGQATTPGSARLTGTVLDTAQLPVSGAIVELLSLGQTRSDDGGAFRFVGVPAGSVILHVAKIGFQPVMKVVALAGGDSVDLDVTLRPAIYQLATVVVHRDSSYAVRSDPTGFDRRRRNGMGHYIAVDEIVQKHFTETSHLLRAMPGVSVRSDGVIRIDRGQLTLVGSACAGVSVQVDGVRMPDDFNVNVIPISAVRGLEVYSGPATTPEELVTSRTVCGTVVIWTR